MIHAPRTVCEELTLLITNYKTSISVSRITCWFVWYDPKVFLCTKKIVLTAYYKFDRPLHPRFRCHRFISFRFVARKYTFVKIYPKQSKSFIASAAISKYFIEEINTYFHIYSTIRLLQNFTFFFCWFSILLQFKYRKIETKKHLQFFSMVIYLSKITYTIYQTIRNKSRVFILSVLKCSRENNK